MDFVDKIFGLIMIGWCLFSVVLYALSIEIGKRHGSFPNGWLKNVLRVVCTFLFFFFAYYFFAILFA